MVTQLLIIYPPTWESKSARWPPLIEWTSRSFEAQQCGTAAEDVTFTSVTPFLQSTKKWFHDPNEGFQTLSASKAQQIANDEDVFQTIYAALFILSRDPWVPSHISLHVRQAALAAVGSGWSWGNQIPTAFPFD